MHYVIMQQVLAPLARLWNCFCGIYGFANSEYFVLKSLLGQ